MLGVLIGRLINNLEQRSWMQLNLLVMFLKYLKNRLFLSFR